MYSKNVRFVEHESEALKGNQLGDPHVRQFPVWLPPDYEASGERRYPVIFGLTGFTGTGEGYLYARYMSPSLDQMLDELVAVGMPGVIYVMPDCLTRLGGSQYVNSSAVGDYEDYIVKELAPFIDERFRTTGLRGVMGGSSGGIGAFTLAAKHPDVFQAFADHSGDSAFDSCYLGDVPKVVQAMEKYDYSVEKFVEQLEETQPKDDSFQIILNMVAMSACYAPNPDVKPLGFELPFDPYTGALRPDVWTKFLTHDPGADGGAVPGEPAQLAAGVRGLREEGPVPPVPRGAAVTRKAGGVRGAARVRGVRFGPFLAAEAAEAEDDPDAGGGVGRGVVIGD